MKTNIQNLEIQQIPEAQKIQDGNNSSLVGGVGKKVNDIINQEYMEKYIGEIRFNSEIDNIEELKSIIIEAIKPNTQFFGDKDIGKIDFNFISSRKEMNEFYGQETEDWLVGSGRDSKVTIFSQKVFDKESNHPKSDFFPILKHEIAHIFSNRIFGYGGVFLNEGISGYIANQSHKLRIVNDFEDIYSRNNWSKNSNYAQAYSFTRFLIDKYGKEKLFELLKNNPNTNNFEQFKEVFTKSYGINFEEVEKEWKNSLNSQENMKQQNISIIQNIWSSYLGIENSDFLEKGIKVISHFKELIDSKEIYVLEYGKGATIISVPEEIKDEIEKIVKEFGQDNNKMHEVITKIYKGNKVNTGYILTNYLFNFDKINEIKPNTRYISKNQKGMFDDFMSKCLEEDKKEVFMEFEEKFHEFYGYFENGELVALANYVRNDENDKLAHIGILLRSDKKGMGYGKILANDITAEILNRNLIPQYRVAESNIASRRIAEKLGYEEILRGYSLRIR